MTAGAVTADGRARVLADGIVRLGDPVQLVQG